jgi:hypothetical protein
VEGPLNVIADTLSRLSCNDIDIDSSALVGKKAASVVSDSESMAGHSSLIDDREILECLLNLPCLHLKKNESKRPKKRRKLEQDNHHTDNCYLIALSTAEAEYISLTQALRETIPLATLMREVNEIFPLYLPHTRFIIKVREDNQSCIAMAENPKFTPRTKHIAIKYHHFRKHVITQANPDGFILLEYCSTHDQITDIFTKPVRDDIFFKLRKSLMGW